MAAFSLLPQEEQIQLAYLAKLKDDQHCPKTWNEVVGMPPKKVRDHLSGLGILFRYKDDSGALIYLDNEAICVLLARKIGVQIPRALDRATPTARPKNPGGGMRTKQRIRSTPEGAQPVAKIRKRAARPSGGDLIDHG